MKLQHLAGMDNFYPRRKSTKIKVAAVSEIDKLEVGLGKLELTPTGETMRFVSQGVSCLIKFISKNQQQDIEYQLRRGQAHLAEITHVSSTGNAELSIVFFFGPEHAFNNITISIPNQIYQKAEQLGIRGNLTSVFKSICSIDGHIIDQDECYVPIIIGQQAKDLWLSGSKAEEEPLISQQLEVDKGFTIIGNGLYLHIAALKQGQDMVLSVKRLQKAHSKVLSQAIHLAKMNLEFVDKEKQLQTVAKTQLATLMADTENPTYFTVWDKYGELEGELLLKRAREIGALVITKVEPLLDEVEVSFSQKIPKALTSSDQVEIINLDQQPLYFSDEKMTWAEYTDTLTEEFKLSKKDAAHNNGSKDVVGSVVQIKKQKSTSLTLDLKQLPVAGTHAIILSINGDKIQVQRRMHARQLILDGRSANPQLGLVIAENGQLTAQKRGKELKALTPFVAEKVFAYPPTPKQEEAIKVALNTPDIALIQGPPGTGKTTVIQGILERLNQEFQKTDDYRGQILVSGFQHDAVENLLARLSINAIPSVKFGKKTGSNFSPDRIDNKISAWCENLAENIRNKNPQLNASQELIDLRKGLFSYQEQPSDTLARTLLQRLQKFVEINANGSLSLRVRLLLQELAPIEVNLQEGSLRLVYGLRCQEQAYLDDGADRALALYEALEDQLTFDELCLLRKASSWKAGRALDFLTDLQQLRRQLLMRYRPRPVFRIAKPRQDILNILNESLEILHNSKQYQNETDAALVDFLYELEHNQESVKSAMAEYNLVCGATVQQSLGRDIRQFKKQAKKNDRQLSAAQNIANEQMKVDLMVRYDTVIIDEAARCSPRDLLIPLAQAEKRIILVGDHRQLPHIVDEEITRQLEEGEQKQTEESMFEYLFKRLKSLESQDGIQRTVTLDAQFRTHPLLGEFASKYFYEVHDINEGYRSPLPVKNFNQSLSKVEGKAAVWLDVPHKFGDEQRDTARSRFRQIEADQIAKQLNEWIHSEAGQMLSFGVISFYKAQVNDVFRALATYGITEKNHGKWQFKPDYRHLANGEERLRIGTVDSFQGMEFDIVFLSMVRTCDVQALQEIDDEDTKKQSQLFGHLMSANRLCVSMTRQKKLLVLTGNAELAQHSITEKAVPALYYFYQLCQQQGIILDAQ